MDILHVINNSGIENPHAALYLNMKDGLLIAYHGKYFQRVNNDANKQASQIYQILSKNRVNVIDKHGYGLIKYNSFDVYLYLNKEDDTLLAIYK